MNCAISGVAPEHPVVSRKSGSVFERRLIEDYISQNGTDPVSGEELSVDDLIEIKTARIVKPRPPTLTSIPSLLSTFQNEWDALSLESFTLKQQLAQTRQELSTALYDFEGALRVIAKLTKERDEARDALSRVTVSGVVNGGSDEMVVDAQPLPEDIVEKITTKGQELMMDRRKKKAQAPAGWVTPRDIQALQPQEIPEAAVPGSRALAVDSSGDRALFGGIDGVAIVYSLSERKTVVSLKCGAGAVTDALFWDSRPIVALSTGEVKIFDADGQEVAKAKAHAGACNGLAIHPVGDLLASVGADKSYVVYELPTLKTLTRIFTETSLTSCHFHPDGNLFGLGGDDGVLRVYSFTTGTFAAEFKTDSQGPIRSVSFSENGTLVAVTAAGTTGVSIFDLRKGKLLTIIDVGSETFHARFDFSGQFLAVGSAGSIAVHEYAKKSFNQLLSKAVPCTDVAWCASAKSLLVLNMEGVLVSLA